MRTIFPEKPARDFNEWMGYIKSEIDKSNKVEAKREAEEEMLKLDWYPQLKTVDNE